MKRSNLAVRLFTNMAILCSALSCSLSKKEDLPRTGGVDMCFRVTISAPEKNKTSYSEDGNLLKTTWTSGDKVSVISLSGGKVATVDTFQAKDGGSASAEFAGTYTGDPAAVKICVYPALAEKNGSEYNSTPTAGNNVGYFRTNSGTDDLIFAPGHCTSFLQTANDDRSHLSDLDLMTGTIDKDMNVSLSKRMSVLQCKFSMPEAGSGEVLKSLTLTLDKGTPFTDYSALNSLTAPAAAWTTLHPKSSITLNLDKFSLSGTTLTAYIPEFVNSADQSLGGDETRTLSICVNSDKFAYKGQKNIPAGSAATYSMTCGKYYEISAALTKDPTPLEGEVLGEEVKFAEISGANCLHLSGNSLYVGASGIVSVYDVSSPMNPVLTGSVSIRGKARQMSVEGNTLVVASRESGVWVIDVSNPGTPSLLKRYDAIELATGIDLAGNCLFVGLRNNGVEFVDLSDRTSPWHINLKKTNESQSVFYSNGYLYSGEWGVGKVTIFDAHDLSDIRQVALVNLQGYGDGVWVKGNRLYVSTGHHHKNSAIQEYEGDGHGVEIWDVSTPESPTFISRAEFNTVYTSSTDWWFPVLSSDNKTLFCCDTYNGVYVVDISDESHPQIIGRRAYPSTTAATGMALGDGVLYISDNSGAVRAIQCPRAVKATKERGTLPVNLSARHPYATAPESAFTAWKPDINCPVHSAVTYSDALFVACGDAGVAVLKKDGTGTVYKHSQATDKFAGDVAIRDNRLYVAEGTDGMAVYTIGTDLSLTLESRVIEGLSSKEANRICLWVFAPNDKYVVAGPRTNGYQFFAVNRSGAVPTYTPKLTFISYNAYVKYIAPEVCSSDRLPFLNRYGLFWFDLGSTSSVTKPTAMSALTGGNSTGICAYKEGKALAIKDKKFHIITPGTTTIENSSAANAAIHGQLRWDGADKVALSDFYSLSVTVADLGNFASPIILAYESTEGKPEPGTFWGGKAVIPCGYQGLLIQK